MIGSTSVIPKPTLYWWDDTVLFKDHNGLELIILSIFPTLQQVYRMMEEKGLFPSLTKGIIMAIF